MQGPTQIGQKGITVQAKVKIHNLLGILRSMTGRERVQETPGTSKTPTDNVYTHSRKQNEARSKGWMNCAKEFVSSFTGSLQNWLAWIRWPLLVHPLSQETAPTTRLSKGTNSDVRVGMLGTPPIPQHGTGFPLRRPKPAGPATNARPPNATEAIELPRAQRPAVPPPQPILEDF